MMRNPLPYLFAALALAACTTTERRVIQTTGEPSATVPEAHDVAGFCGAMCDRVQECDRALDHQTCKNQCTNANAAAFPKLRDDVVDLVLGCFTEKDCKAVLGGIGACTADAAAQVAPSEAAVGLCDALAKAREKCGASSGKAECLTLAKLYDDDAIAEAQNCTGRRCAEMDACVAAALAPVGTPPPGSKPESPTCSMDVAAAGACSECASACCDEATACFDDPECRWLMQSCAPPEVPTSTCMEYVQAASTRARQLAGPLYQCAQTKCDASCRWSSQF